MRFERIVVVGRGGIGVVERDGSVCERGLDVAAERVGVVAEIDLLRIVQICAICTQLDVMRRLIIVDNDEARGLTGDLGCLSDDGGNELAIVGDGSGLEHGQFSIVKWRETRRILVREHGNDTRKSTRSTRIDRDDPAPGDGALHRKDVCHAFDRVLVGVWRCAGDLLWTIDAVQRCADSPYGEVHAWSPSSMRSSSASMTVVL